MEQHNEYSPIYKDGENEINVISPRDIQDGQSEDPEVELSMTESENEQAEFNDRVSEDEENGEADEALTAANE